MMELEPSQSAVDLNDDADIKTELEEEEEEDNYYSNYSSSSSSFRNTEKEDQVQVKVEDSSFTEEFEIDNAYSSSEDADQDLDLDDEDGDVDKLKCDSSIPRPAGGVFLTYPIVKYFSTFCEVVVEQRGGKPTNTHRRRVSYYKYFTSTVDNMKKNKVIARTCRRCGEAVVVTTPRHCIPSLRQHLRSCQVSKQNIQISCRMKKKQPKINQQQQELAPVAAVRRCTRSKGSSSSSSLLPQGNKPAAAALQAPDDSMMTAREWFALQRERKAAIAKAAQNQKLSQPDANIRKCFKKARKRKGKRRAVFTCKAAQTQKLARLNETPQQHMERLAKQAERGKKARANEAPEVRAARFALLREKYNKRRQWIPEIPQEVEMEVFSCDLCSDNVSFGEEFLLEMHKRQDHHTSITSRGSTSRSVTCVICKAKFKDVATLNKHTTKSHPTL